MGIEHVQIPTPDATAAERADYAIAISANLPPSATIETARMVAAAHESQQQKTDAAWVRFRAQGLGEKFEEVAGSDEDKAWVRFRNNGGKS